MNPADLFTKHLSSAERIKSLLDLFGCGYQSGRAASAPKLREGVGGTAGEMLHVEEYEGPTVQYGGYTFPVAMTDGEATPEAYRHDTSKLPHQHQCIDELSPKAIAAADAGDQDLEEEDAVEKHGVELGRRGGR